MMMSEPSEPAEARVWLHDALEWMCAFQLAVWHRYVDLCIERALGHIHEPVVQSVGRQRTHRLHLKDIAVARFQPTHLDNGLTEALPIPHPAKADAPTEDGVLHEEGEDEVKIVGGGIAVLEELLHDREDAAELWDHHEGCCQAILKPLVAKD